LGILPHSGVGNCVPKKICMSDNICAHSTIIWLYQWPIITHHHPWGLVKNIACPINGYVTIGKCFYSVIHMILGQCFFFNFVMVLKCQSSIRTFSQIWQHSMKK
jgi:hypothetical protein